MTRMFIGKHLLQIDRDLRPYGFTREDAPRGSGHWVYQHASKEVAPVTVSKTPRNADIEIAFALREARQNLRAAGLPDEPKPEARGARADQSEADIVRALELLPKPGWADYEEICEMMDVPASNRVRTALTTLTARGVLVSEATDDGRLWRLRPVAKPATISRKDLTMRTVPAGLVPFPGRNDEKVVEAYQVIMDELEKKGYARASDVIQAVKDKVGVGYASDVAKQVPDIHMWFERRKQGYRYWALPGVTPPNSRPAAANGTPDVVQSAPTPPKPAAAPPAPAPAVSDASGGWERVQALLDEIVASQVAEQTAALMMERDDAIERLDTIRKALGG